MSQIEVCLPKLGESILSATVIQWMKKEGDVVREDEPLLEVATDKVNSEIPSPAAGKLVKILVTVDSEIDIGTPLALLEVEGEGVAVVEPTHHAEEHPVGSAGPGFLSPAVLRLAQEHGIPLDKLSQIKGTGRDGRITRKDIEAFAMGAGDTEPLGHGEVERLPMSPMRKAIAENMVRSFYQAPHAYLMTEVDVTDLRTHIGANREAFLDAEGVKLTLTPYLIKALSAAVKTHPLLNASMGNDEILIKKEVNVGIAVAVGDGLMVPVLKKCSDQDIASLAHSLHDLSARARKNQLKPDEVMDGTITLTNFGMSGAAIGLPIIRYPEVAIVGIGAVKKQFVPDANGQPVVREIFNATLSFDHRAVDGMYAAAFLTSFKQAVETQR